MCFYTKPIITVKFRFRKCSLEKLDNKSHIYIPAEHIDIHFVVC